MATTFTTGKEQQSSTTTLKCPTIQPKRDNNFNMKVVEWQGARNLKIAERPKPMITDPTDCIVRITSTTICGSDLHMYHKEVKAMEKGDVLGHECMGIVESVGPEVKNVKVGDRVVVSAVISCGCCQYCKKGLFSCCDVTNPSKECEEMYGHRLSGIFGYSHLTGGYDGGQAEFVRVPLADVNTLKITGKKDDEYYLFLSDIMCTGYHACELAEVTPGKTVVIWGCGPVGLSAQMWAKYRGASRVIAVDGIDYRLQTANKVLGSEIIDFRKGDVVKQIQKLLPGGPDCVIETVGFRYAKSDLHKKERENQQETDTPEILTEMILSVNKGGNMSIIGDYFGYANHFPIGALMEKGVTTRGSQVYVQKYWKNLLEIIESGKVDPTFLVTHQMDLNSAVDAYKIFDEKRDNVLKIVLKPKTPTTGPK